MRKIGGDFQVSRPECFRVVCPLDHGTEGGIGLGIPKMHQAQSVIKSNRLPVIAHQIFRSGGVLRKNDSCGPHIFYGITERKEYFVFYTSQI